MTATVPETAAANLGTRFPATLVPVPLRQQLPFGLFSQTTFPATDDRFALGGIEWQQQLPCSPNAKVLDVTNCDGWPTESVLVDNECTSTTFASFAVAVEVKKSILSLAGVDHQQYAAAYLGSQEQFLAEQHTWAQLLNWEGHPAVSALDELDALAQAERVIGNTGFLGTIHMSRYVATWLMGRYELVANGDRLFTKLGTPVVAGAGYATDNAPSTLDTEQKSSIFVTPGLITGYRGSVEVLDALDVTMNDEVLRAVRPYALAWEGCARPTQITFSIKTA